MCVCLVDPPLPRSLSLPPSPKLKFGIRSRVIGGLERATEPPPRCLSCHVGGVDLVILWESKVPLTAAWGVIHRAAHDEVWRRGGGGGSRTLSAMLLMSWSPEAPCHVKRGNGDFVVVC